RRRELGAVGGRFGPRGRRGRGRPRRHVRGVFSAAEGTVIALGESLTTEGARVLAGGRGGALLREQRGGSSEEDRDDEQVPHDARPPLATGRTFIVLPPGCRARGTPIYVPTRRVVPSSRTRSVTVRTQPPSPVRANRAWHARTFFG